MPLPGRPTRGGRPRPRAARPLPCVPLRDGRPYGDPDGNWVWRNAFDEGEYGLGRLATPLEPSKDAPGNADFVDVTFAGTNGAHYVLENALTLYERDGGLLWKHFDYETGKSDARRARELVIGYTVVVGNYDYGVSWIFRQDGSLEMEAALTGILLGKGVEATACESCAGLAEGRPLISGSERTGTLVGPNIIAPNHQHPGDSVEDEAFARGEGEAERPVLPADEVALTDPARAVGLDMAE